MNCGISCDASVCRRSDAAGTGGAPCWPASSTEGRPLCRGVGGEQVLCLRGASGGALRGTLGAAGLTASQLVGEGSKEKTDSS